MINNRLSLTIPISRVLILLLPHVLSLQSVDHGVR